MPSENDTDFAARLAFAAHVAGRGRIVADQHRRQPRRDTMGALEGCHLLLHLRSHRLRRRAAVDESRPMRRPYSMAVGCKSPGRQGRSARAAVSRSGLNASADRFT